MTAPRQKNDLLAEIERYRKSLEENPGSRLFAALADSMRRSGDVAGAITVAENGLKRHPRYLGGMVVLGQAYADNQQFDRGKELFLQVVRMNPENIVAQRALADIYEKLGENFNAMRTYAILNILDPSDKKVRARLQELEESRAGASRPASAPKPFSTPPAAKSPEPPPPEPEETSPTETVVPPPPPPAADAPAPPETAPVADAAGSAATSSPDAEPEAPLPLATAQPSQPEPTPETVLPPEPAPESAPPPEPAGPVIKPEVVQRMAGLDQFFAADQPQELESTPPAIPPVETVAPSDESVPADEGSDTAVIPAEPATPPAPPPPPGFTLEEKLDLFFGGADFERIGVAEKAENFVVRAAQEALVDQPEAENPPPPLAAGPEVKVTRSKLGAIFWDQGFRDKALNVMAAEINSRPGDALLRAEFSFVARSLDHDPDAMLESLSPGLSVRTAAPAPEPKPEAATAPPEPSSAPAPAATAVAAPDGSAADVLGETTTDQRINILRSYLKRVRKDKES